MEKDFKEQDSNADDWGNPPAPQTPENQKKAFRSQMIIGVVALTGILLPGLMFWLLRLLNIPFPCMNAPISTYLN